MGQVMQEHVIRTRKVVLASFALFAVIVLSSGRVAAEEADENQRFLAALEKRQLAVVKQMLDGGYQLPQALSEKARLIGHQWSPSEELFTAALTGNLPPNNEILRLLLKAGANPNDYLGCPALHMATYLGDRETFEVLLDAGADPNLACSKYTYTNGQTALMGFSFGHADKAIAALLLERGADPSLGVIDTPCGDRGGIFAGKEKALLEQHPRCRLLKKLRELASSGAEPRFSLRRIIEEPQASGRGEQLQTLPALPEGSLAVSAQSLLDSEDIAEVTIVQRGGASEEQIASIMSGIGVSRPSVENLSAMRNPTPELLLQLSAAGKAKLAAATKEAVGKRLAIVFAGTVLSAPVVREEITSGQLQVSGPYSLAMLRAVREGLRKRE